MAPFAFYNPARPRPEAAAVGGIASPQPQRGAAEEGEGDQLAWRLVAVFAMTRLSWVRTVAP